MANASAKQKTHQKAYLWTKQTNKQTEDFFWKKSREYGPVGSRKTRRKEQQVYAEKNNNKQTKKQKKRVVSKVESNDSPEIPGKRETSDISGLPSLAALWRKSPAQDMFGPTGTTK